MKYSYELYDALNGLFVEANVNLSENDMIKKEEELLIQYHLVARNVTNPQIKRYFNDSGMELQIVSKPQNCNSPSP